MMLVAVRVSEALHQHRRPQQMPLVVGQVVMRLDRVAAVQVALDPVVRLSQEIVMLLDDGVIASILDRGSGFIHYGTNLHGIKMVIVVLQLIYR